MNRWILTHARLAFWLWTVPSLALLVWYAARNEGEGLMTAYALFALWEAMPWLCWAGVGRRRTLLTWPRSSPGCGKTRPF